MSQLLSWKAKHFRAITGDDRFRSPLEVRRTSFLARLRVAVYRPFVMIWTETIILLLALYLTILYIVLFTFFVAFPFVFEDVYGISQGLTNIIWLAVFVGFWPLGLTLHIVWKWTLQDIAAQSEATGTTVTAPRAETRLYFAMLGGAVSEPILAPAEAHTNMINLPVCRPDFALLDGVDRLQLDINLVSDCCCRTLWLWSNYALHLRIHVYHCAYYDMFSGFLARG